MLSTPRKKAVEKKPPLAELSELLTSLEDSIQQARTAHVESVLNPQQPSQTKAATPGTLSRLLFRRNTPTKKENDDAKSPALQNTPSSPTTPVKQPTNDNTAKFIHLSNNEESLIETLRRIAELVIVGENFVTTEQKRQEMQFRREQERWKTNRDALLFEDAPDDENKNKSIDEKQQQEEEEGAVEFKEEYLQLFDLFFERNALETIINLITGRVFELTEEEKSAALEEKEEVAVEKEETKEDDASNTTTPPPKATTAPKRPPIDDSLRLPGIPIATQALQSISILIQNVSRATSLYVILSNNRINDLIKLPLDMYCVAERHRQLSADPSSTPSRRLTFSSPEMSELTTHFITFLKSLALRMNAETLQFYLKYPQETTRPNNKRAPASPSLQAMEEENGGDIPLDEKGDEESILLPTKSMRVDFPLYERALEFCGAHHDSFVRVTAMNICLNTLRLTTVSADDEEDESLQPTKENTTPSRHFSLGSSPDGVLHHARPLPFRERLAIAQYTCIPSRVEQLISPIFTKLAERWNVLDEKIREIDSNKDLSPGSIGGEGAGSRNENMARAKERVRRERLIRAFKDKAADMQDELLILDDVFKIGLTVLNEQLIEMMLATFVYPLLLQPLLLYYQRLDPALEQQKHSFSIHPFGGYTGDYSDVERNLSPVAGPAKTALFSLASTFQLLTNTALRRLIFTALLHPLSPDATGVPTLRSTLEVATIKNGRKSIRLDTQLPHSSGDRMTYHFGTTPGRRRESRVNVDLSLVQDDGEACIFVLSPALAEVLEFRGEDMSLFARTKPNPYRRALLRCLDVPCDLSDIRELAVCTIDAAMSASDSQFASEIVFGTDLKKFADDIPSDERDLDSTLAHALDDRDIGGGISESRTSLRRSPGGKVGSDLTGEIVKALCRCIIVATKHRQRACEWKIEFDELASHSLLYVIRQNRAAMETAAKTIAQLWKQTASFIAAIPANTSTPMGGSDIPMEGAPSVNDPEYDKLIEGALMNFIFFDAIDGSGPKPVVDEFLLLERESQDEQPTYSVPIGLESSFDALCGRIGRFLLDGVDADATQLTDKEEVFLARLDVRRLMKLDALLSLVKDLAATNGALLRDSSLAGIAISAVGRVVDTKRALVQDFSRRVYAPLSTAMVQRLFGDEGAEPLPESGSLIDLAGKPLLPCVCEVPAHAAPLFAGVNGVVSEGVTWQSLYIVFSGEFLILAHPLPESGSIEGRVITSCLLERITVLKDFVHDDSGPPARRLILSHKWFSGQPPQLFLLDAVPKAEKIGPFERKESIVSTLDVWFEDQMSADRAYQILTSQAFVTKAMRGFRMEEFFGL